MDRRRFNSGDPRRPDGQALRSPRDGGQIRRDRMDQLKGNEIKIERRAYKTGFDLVRKAAEVFNKDRIQRIKGFAKDFNTNLDQIINIYQYIDGLKYIPDSYKRKVLKKELYNIQNLSMGFKNYNEKIKESYKNRENKEIRDTHESAGVLPKGGVLKIRRKISVSEPQWMS